MRNFNLLTIALFAIMLGFSSCSKDDNDNEASKGSFTANGKSSSLNWARWKSYEDRYGYGYIHHIEFYQDDYNQYETPITYTDEYGTHTDDVLTKRPPNNYGGFVMSIATDSLSIAGTYIGPVYGDYNMIWSHIKYNWKKEYNDKYKVDEWDYYSSYNSYNYTTFDTLTIKQEGNSYTFSFKGKGEYYESHDGKGYTNKKENINIEMNYTGEFNEVEHSGYNSYSTPVKSAKRESDKRVMKFRKVGE